MKTHEMIIDVDNGKFIGTTKEVEEYLGIKADNQITKYARCRLKFRGHDLKRVGTLKHVMIYGLLDEKNNLAFKGSAKEISKKYLVSVSCIHNNAKNKCKLLGKYTVIKIEFADVIERNI